jgi:mono/diheme cytochrome c family protein
MRAVTTSRARAALCLAGLAFSTAVVVATMSVSAQEKTVEQGVYTTAQANRGQKVYETQCTTCHREPGGNAVVIVGERFTRSFAGANLLNFFNTIKTSMPRSAPGSLTDAEYSDVVAHVLRLNGYADGTNELAMADMAGITIPGQTGNLDQALVQVVGCLARNGRIWTLFQATDPVRTRDPEPAKEDEAAKLDGLAASGRTYRLQQVYSAPTGWTNQRVAAKGFLSQTGGEDRVTVTSLRPLTATCQQ